MPGVHAVITHEDVPKNVYGHLEALGVPADEPLLAEDDVRWKGQLVAAVAAESEETAHRGRRRDRGRLRGARAGLRHPHRLRPGRPDVPPVGPDLSALRPAQPPPRAQGRRRPGVRGGRPDRRGRLPPAGDRARADGDPGRARRAGAERPPDDLLLHAGDVLLDGRRRRAPAVAAEQAEVRRRHGRRRLRRQGRHGDGDDLRAAGAEVQPPGQVALHARGGVPGLLDARAVAHRDQGRGHQGRLDPRPAHADAARRGRLRALLALRPDQARLPPHGRLHDPEPALRRLRRLHQPRADDRHARLRRHVGVDGDRDAHEPDRRASSASTRSSCGSRTPTAIGDTTGNRVRHARPLDGPGDARRGRGGRLRARRRVPRDDQRAAHGRPAARAPRRPAGARGRAPGDLRRATNGGGH